MFVMGSGQLSAHWFVLGAHARNEDDNPWGGGVGVKVSRRKNINIENV